MEFKTQEKLGRKVTVIECPIRLDASLADDFKAKMNELVDQGKYQLVIDLQQTTFIDSIGLGSLVSRIAAIRSNQGGICLVSPSPTIWKVFEITHLDKIFKCFDDIESAVKSYE